MKKIAEYLISNKIVFSYIQKPSEADQTAMAFHIHSYTGKNFEDLMSIISSENVSVQFDNGIRIFEKVVVKKVPAVAQVVKAPVKKKK